jgi:hypothetical protein
MSIYATNFIIDEETGEVKLIKHLNKIRVDRGTTSKRGSGKWNKSGIKARELKGWRKHIKELRRWSLSSIG